MTTTIWTMKIGIEQSAVVKFKRRPGWFANKINFNKAVSFQIKRCAIQKMCLLNKGLEKTGFIQLGASNIAIEKQVIKALQDTHREDFEL